MRLDKKTRERVIKELQLLTKMPHPTDHTDVNPLVGELRGFSRLRIGSCRVIFAVLSESRTIAVVNIAPRGDVYK